MSVSWRIDQTILTSQLRHDLGAEQLQRAHGVPGRDVAEGEDAKQVIDPGGLYQLRELVGDAARRAGEERMGGLRRVGFGVVHRRAPELAREVMHVRVPSAVRLLAEAHRLGPVLRDYQVLGLGEERL